MANMYSQDLSSYFLEAEEGASVVPVSYRTESGLVDRPTPQDPQQEESSDYEPLGFLDTFVGYAQATYDNAVNAFKAPSSDRATTLNDVTDQYLSTLESAPAVQSSIEELSSSAVEYDDSWLSTIENTPGPLEAISNMLNSASYEDDEPVTDPMSGLREGYMNRQGDTAAFRVSGSSENADVVPTFDASSASSLPGIYATKGAAYRDSSIASNSYYKAPVADRAIRGSSRIHGDASKDVQKAAMEAIIAHGVKAGLNKDEIALTLSIARHESGFNPDAAAGTTSAHGLGQFINKTGKGYGLTDDNRWQLTAQARALVEHTKDNIALAKRRNKGTEYVYKYHHDGPSKNYGGLSTSKNKVMPLVSTYRKFLDDLDIPDKPPLRPKARSD